MESKGRDADYFQKNYGLTLPHTDVVAASELIKPCAALDLGCGMGRNSLFLNELGFTMTSVDANPNAIESLKAVIETESIEGITPFLYNINDATLDGEYGFIFSTVVFMFLEAERIPYIIRNMQQSTAAGGYNLIVSAMHTDRYPCHQGFSFTFGEGELADYYKNWELVTYNEDVGELHRVDENGNRIQLQFATMLAKRIA
ncbi:tellurite resistance methyltransferase TehB [Ignatzschineria sp. RMDPL8A]|uniref:tellurite resistance methyltransferase TehB n=1 Tax=Ignatzschineria sp. RMDPL8A TaxID=2999236 RepID=UPI00244674AC|nr:tellurite resistance methyltransferase TehB [Ignatzschineria sp. RMDPL8A]MDG9729430.1 tellurite resistance methyltransferase TehB [Ignatzschineria sp. RMDPL8A]